MSEGARRLGETLLGWAQALGVIFAALAVAVIFHKQLAGLEAHLLAHRAAWLWGTIAPTSVGLVLFVLGAVLGLCLRGRRMTSDELTAAHRASLGSGRSAEGGGVSVYRKSWRWAKVKGAGASFDTELSFSEAKQVLLSGLWLRDPQWWFFAPMFAGGLLLVFGGFAIAFVFVPSWIKLIIAGYWLYALVRLTWAFWRA